MFMGRVFPAKSQRTTHQNLFFSFILIGGFSSNQGTDTSIISFFFNPERSFISNQWVNYLPQWWVELDDELSCCLLIDSSATRYMKVKGIGITEILRRIWLIREKALNLLNSKQPIQLIVQLKSSFRHIIVIISPIRICLWNLK